MAGALAPIRTSPISSQVSGGPHIRQLWSLRRLSIWSEPGTLELRDFGGFRRDQMNMDTNA